jgi:radical SAM protein with 4Fe4S-binding SPASM domain
MQKFRDIYLYPASGSLWLLYSPMLRKAVWSKNSELPDSPNMQNVIDKLQLFTLLKEQKNKVRQPEDYPLLTVLPNQKCNLRCVYCYSAAGRNSEELDINVLKRTIDFFIGSKPDGFGKPLSVSFMGGGEPLLSWDTVKQGIVYARQTADKRHLPIDFTVITNGTLLDDDMLDFLCKNNVNVSVSFEIIEEIQNLQRGNCLNVIKNLKRLVDNGITPQINATITPANVERQIEMIEIIEARFPTITNMMFEPVIAPELFVDELEMSEFYDRYTANFIAALQRFRQNGKSLTSFPYLRTVFPVERSCMGELCLAPNGDIACCYCITSPTDDYYTKVVYGKVKKSGVEFDRKKFDVLLADNVYMRPECTDCEVKWNCGGGCLYHRFQYKDTFDSVVCNFIRNFVKNIITERFRYRYIRQWGAMPEDSLDTVLLTRIIDN